MAEDGEVPKPEELVDRHRVVATVRERTKGILDTVAEINPMTKASAEQWKTVQDALPEGRIRDSLGFALDMAKLPRAVGAVGLETVKTIFPVIRLALLPGELGARFFGEMRGTIAKSVIESGPARFAIGSAEGIANAILGSRPTTRIERAGPGNGGKRPTDFGRHGQAGNRKTRTPENDITLYE